MFFKTETLSFVETFLFTKANPIFFFNFLDQIPHLTRVDRQNYAGMQSVRERVRQAVSASPDRGNRFLNIIRGSKSSDRDLV